ncbi:MAG: hypothetical protein ACKPAD_14675, partial [Bacteroidota bacterium]
YDLRFTTYDLRLALSLLAPSSLALSSVEAPKGRRVDDLTLPENDLLSKLIKIIFNPPTLF